MKMELKCGGADGKQEWIAGERRNGNEDEMEFSTCKSF